MELSRFGESLTAGSGIVSLMEDLGNALRENPEMLFLGGGNPARIPDVEKTLRQALERVLARPEQAYQMLGVYPPPAGDGLCRRELAALLRREFGWALGPENIAFANGSQSAFFVLFNLLAGESRAGRKRHIQLPLVPEYLGYSDLGLASEFYRAARPQIECLPGRQFKYHVDFQALDISSDCAALCVSRPTNPTGNVITDEEMARLGQMARRADIPLIVDGAYGLPFPGIVFNQASSHWDDNTVLVLSLSKLGLPGVRSSIVIARDDIIGAFAQANTVLSLAAGNVGPAVVRELMASEQLLALGRTAIGPFYRRRAQWVMGVLMRALDGLPYRIHRPEGAIFLWLWFEGLPISSDALYRRLKERGVLVIAGEHFFPGLAEPWPHKYECLRLSYAQSDEVVTRAVAILADEVRALYAEGPEIKSGES